MKIKKLLSLFLALALVFSCAGGWSVRAEEAEDPALAPTLSDAAQTAVAEAAPLENIHTEELPFLRYIDEGQFFEADHVARLSEEESLDTYVFLNRDGTKSVYYMGRDVKFVDTDGTVRDKDTTLIPADGGYTMRQNDVGILLPEDPATGVLVVSGSHGLRLVPQGGSGTGVLTDNAMLYEDFYGAGMSLKYTPMLDGVKEDIILNSYSGVSSFEFSMVAHGLSLYQRDGIWHLAASETAEAVFTLGEILIYDAVGKPTLGTLAVAEIRAGVYTLTVSAPVEFLTDPTTVYPVTIDPTITSKDTMTAANIEDATVFSGYPNNNFGNYVFNTIGYQDATYGTGRVAVRLKGLLNDATYQGLSAADISSVLFYMKDGGSNYAYVNIHALTGNSTWTESTIKNSNLGTVSDTAYTNGRMGGSAWTAFNLTTLVKDWKDGDQNGQCGFLMVIADSTKKIGALSCEYGSGDYWPYVVVEYTVSSVLNYSVKDIVEGTSFTLTANTGGVAADITWTSNNPTVATVSSSGVVAGIHAGTAIITATSDVFTEPVSCTVYVTIEDGVYYIKNNQSSYYLSVQDAGVASGTPVLQQSKVTSDPVRLAQLWKITHLGGTTYSIRPMHSLTKGLDVTGSKVDIYEIGEYDSLFSVPDYAEWTITYRDGGLVIQRGTDYSQAMAPTNLSGTVNNTLFVGTYTGATSAYRWSLEDPTVDVNDQLVMYDSREKRFVETGMAAVTERYVAPQETRTISNLEISASFVSVQTNEQDIRWYSNNTTIVAVDEYTGAVTGVSPGWTTVYAKQYGTTYTKSYTIIVTEIPEGTYCIRNKFSGRYVDIANQSMEDGTTTHQWEFQGGNTQRWEFTHLGDGTYTICSANSGETVKYFLGVSGDSAANDQPVVLRTGSVTSGMQWKISITTSRAYKLTPLTGEANNRVLALDDEITADTEGNGDTLRQQTYSGSMEYFDEWHIWAGIDIGMSTDNYTDGCTHGERGSYHYANSLFDELTSSPGEGPITKTHRYNYYATKLASISDFNENGAISDDIDFMIYIGHGLQATNTSGNYLHYNCAPDGSSHTADHMGDAFNLYTTDVEFGSADSDLRWVWLYTCNFLNSIEDKDYDGNDNDNAYVTNAMLTQMMKGVHIVMGYASRATLCDAMVLAFAENLRDGMPIYDAYFHAGHDGEASIEEVHHYQKIMYVPQARYETIYSPDLIAVSSTSNVLIVVRNIHDEY